MSRWNIAAAQYAPRHNCVDEHVKHHLHFIAEAAWHGCDLIVFPELSLTGPGGTSLPPPHFRYWLPAIFSERKGGQ